MRHLGYKKETGSEVVIVFRELPANPSKCLIIDLDVLDLVNKDAIRSFIQNSASQRTDNIYNHLHETQYQGSSYLEYFHRKGQLFPYDSRAISVNYKDQTIGLDEYNRIMQKINEGNGDKTDEEIAQQKNVYQAKLDEDAQNEKENLGKGLLRQAETLEAQAKAFLDDAANKRKQAEQYLPPKKKTRKGKAD